LEMLDGYGQDFFFLAVKPAVHQTKRKMKIRMI